MVGVRSVRSMMLCVFLGVAVAASFLLANVVCRTRKTKQSKVAAAEAAAAAAKAVAEAGAAAPLGTFLRL